MLEKLDSFQTIPEAFFRLADEMPDGQVCWQGRIPAGQGPDSPQREWAKVTRKEAADIVRRVASYLKSLGVGKGSKVAIVSNSRREWLEADLAILTAGAVSVSVYQSLKPHEIGYILFDSGADVVFAENQEQADKLLGLCSEACKIPATEERPAQEARISLKRIIAFEAVKPNERIVSWKDAIAFEAAPGIDENIPGTRSDLASLVYTSGTTGPPKGVIQTHGNHLANVRQSGQAGIYGSDSSIMVFLPLAHSFAKLMGYIGYLTSASLRFPAAVSTTSSKIEPKALSHDIREAGATIIPIVPRFLEKMQAALQQRATRRGPKSWLFRLTLWSASEVSEARLAGDPVPGLANLIFGMCEPVRARIKSQLFGDRFEYSIAGGAKLPVDVTKFFDSLEIEILEGYGLTETCVATNLNRPGQVRFGSVGPVLSPDIELKLAEDGEILFKGPNVTSGYLNRKAATASSWDSEGWFHTGDLGRLDDDLYLYIVGRKKELLVTAGGKKIATENIEQEIKRSPFVSQAVLVGEGKPYCAALVTLNEKTVEAAAAKQGWKPSSNLHEDQRVKDMVWRDVAKINEGLASYESVKKIAILPVELTVENGFLTPTFKVKRAVVTKAYAEIIEGLFAGGKD